MKNIFRLFSLSLLIVLSQLGACATEVSDKAVADSAFVSRNYVAARQHYQVLADSLHSADVYYNLGCTEYRLKHYPEAILAFERALREDPGHADARYNLEVTRTRLTDRFTRPAEMVFISWIRQWVQERSVSHWTELSFLWLILMFVGLGVYLYAKDLRLRKIGFFFGILCIFCCLTVTGFAAIQRYRYFHEDRMVITAEEVVLYASPSKSSKQVMQVHEGTTLTILEELDKKWIQVALPDGREAWMSDKGFERIAE